MSKKTLCILIFILISIVCILIFAFLYIYQNLDTFFYPEPTKLTKTIETPIEIILNDLENILITKYPYISKHLQEGLTEEGINELENLSGIKISKEFRSLYKWHNGCSTNENVDFIPGHEFLPLDFSIDQSIILNKEIKSLSFTQKLLFKTFAGYRKNWLTIFDDRCGDGFFYDPQRKENRSCIFYHFSEHGYYIFFPSLKNLLVAITECYKQDVYVYDNNTNQLTCDYEKESEIFAKYSSETY